MAIIGPRTTPDKPPPPRGLSPRRRRRREWLEAPLRRPLLAVVPVTVGLLAAVALSVLLSPRYRASALVRAVWERETDTALRRVSGDVAARKLQSVRGRVVARSLIQRVLGEVGPYRSVHGEDPPPAEQLEKMLRSVSVEPRGADSFVIRFAHEDPQTAAHVSNRLASLLVEEAEEERARRSRVDPSLLEARLDDARKALEERGEVLRRGRDEDPAGASGEPGAAPARLVDASRRVRPSTEDLEKLAREFDEAHRAYLALQDEWRAAETAARTGGSAIARFTVVQAASIPSRPYFPSIVQFALVGLALGLALGLGASVVAESRDRLVRGPEDLQEALPQPLLAELPLVRTPRARPRK